MKALISPIEPRETGFRIAQVINDNEEFGVASPLFWIDCSNEIKADQFWYDPLNQSINPMPAPSPPSAEDNKKLAIALLDETDWVNQPDVINPEINPHLLNHDAFIEYRSQVRVIAINPIEGSLNWPIKPDEEWSSV